MLEALKSSWNPAIDEVQNRGLIRGYKSILTREVQVDEAFWSWIAKMDQKMKMQPNTQHIKASSDHLIIVNSKKLKYHLYALGKLLWSRGKKVNVIRVFELSDSSWFSGIEGLNMKTLYLPNNTIGNQYLCVNLLLLNKNEKEGLKAFQLMQSGFSSCQFYYLMKKIGVQNCIQIKCSRIYAFNFFEKASPSEMLILFQDRIQFLKSSRNVHVRERVELKYQYYHNKQLLQFEVENLKDDHLLLKDKNFSVYIAKAFEIPYLMEEIAFQREVAFKEVGEGSGALLDKDVFDDVYNQIFLWDHHNHKIAGAYRLGLGNEITKQQYLSTLFDYDEDFEVILKQSIELGRSFVSNAYQKSPLALMLLWKGILQAVLRYPEYKYLIGPVSISNDYSCYAKKMMISFIERFSFDRDFKNAIQGKEWSLDNETCVIDEQWINLCQGNVNLLDTLLQENNAHEKFPVLLKKYLNQKARVIAFNQDRKFKDAIDVLMLLDLSELPMDMINRLGGENEKSLLYRRLYVQS